MKFMLLMGKWLMMKCNLALDSVLEDFDIPAPMGVEFDFF